MKVPMRVFCLAFPDFALVDLDLHRHLLGMDRVEHLVPMRRQPRVAPDEGGFRRLAPAVSFASTCRAKGACGTARQDLRQAEQGDDFDALHLLTVQVTEIALVAGNKQVAATADGGTQKG
jgi:hypothetical protein